MNLTNLISNTDFFEGEIISIKDHEKHLADIKGGGGKGMLIIIFRKEEEQMPFLEKVFSAIKMDLKKDMFLLKLDVDAQFQLVELQKKSPFREIIFFGFDPKQVGLNLNLAKYSSVLFNELKIMKADGLEAIAGNEKLKRELWNALKTWND